MKQWLAMRVLAAAVCGLVVYALGGVAQAATVGNFSYGQLQSALVGGSGCGTNSAGEPAIHVSRANNVFLGSELGLGGGSLLWRGLGATGGASASGCGLEFRGQPNAIGGAGASGGDIDVAIASATNSSGNYDAYQAFVAPSSSSGAHNNEAFLGVSADGGHTWADNPIACSTASASTDLNHNFPNVSVDPTGNVWYAWSDDKNIYTAESTDHGKTWSCSAAVSTGTAQAIFPWLVASTGGVDLVYYGAPTASNQTWSVYFAQNTAGSWGAPQQLMAVHQGSVCEGGINCTSGRNLFDDFGVDTDSSGWAHIAFSQDSPSLGGSGTSTGYAVQTGGTAVGGPNN